MISSFFKIDLDISIYKLSENQVAEAAATIIVPLETLLSEGLVLVIQDLEPKNISFWDPSAVAFRRQHNISDDIGAGL